MIQGKDCLIQVLVGDEFQDVLCAKSINIQKQAALKETTTKGDGRYTTWDYDQLSARVTFESLLRIQADSEVTIFDFDSWQNQFLTVEFRIIFKVPQPVPPDKVKIFRGVGVIQNINENATPTQLTDGTVELQVTGQYFLEDAIPEYIDFRLLSEEVVGAEIEARHIVRLLDDLDNVVWSSENLNEAVMGYLVHPFDVTDRVLKGWYRIQLITETNTQFGNIFEVKNPVPENRSFSYGSQDQILIDNPDNFNFEVDQEAEFHYGEVVPPPECVNVQVVGAVDMPDATENTPYSYSFNVTGSAPFVISNVTKPEWMILNINSSGLVTITGTPPVPATAVTVSFDITNCTSGIVNINQTIDVIDLPDPIELAWGYTKNSLAGIMRIYRNSILTVEADETDSGNLILSDGDTIQITVSGANAVKTLIVSNNVDGTMYNVVNSISSLSYTFTVETGKDYTATGETDNIF